MTTHPIRFYYRGAIREVSAPASGGSGEA